ncbi:uridine kinase [Gorillibacterium massiliense]|uniref:uridine kinase n=1 Tax=Gorillibacterium massiliense TaxID=1280390 RepID=UPI0004B2CFAA|nr:uridine kinase [Gorillibacterium massiliense]
MLIIGIAGGTGSGKTTVARSIIQQLGTDNVAFISQDNFYADGSHLTFEQRKHTNYDHPDSFDNSLLLERICELRSGSDIHIPVYDFTTHTRTQETVSVPFRPVVVLEGIHVLSDPELREVLDIKIFVDTEPDVRLLRRILRDINERGRSLESIHAQYIHSVKPMHEAFIEPSKKYADIIIPEGGENEIGISLITARIERYLSEL